LKRLLQEEKRGEVEIATLVMSHGRGPGKIETQ